MAVGQFLSGMSLIGKIVLATAASKIVQFFFNLLFGPSTTDRKTNGVLCYNIIKDWKFWDFQTNEQGLFLLKFSGVKDIAWIEREDISLYCVDSTHFTFVRTKAGVDIYDAELHPFLYMIKHDTAVELMTVEHGVIFDYLRGCGKADRDGSNIAYLHNIGRCGSTLATTMVNKTRQCHVLSEPNGLVCLADMFCEEGPLISPDKAEIYRVIRSTLILLTPNPNKHYFIKIHSKVMNILPVIHTALPGVREMFMYRALKPTANSFKKAFAGTLTFSQMEKFILLKFPKISVDLWQQNRVADSDYFILFMAITNIHFYMTAVEDRKTKQTDRPANFRSFSYESLLNDKVAFCREFFKDAGIREEFVEIGLTALDRDSQTNSVLSKANLSKNITEVAEEALEYAKKVGREAYGIEIAGEDYHIVNMPCRWDQ